MTWSPSWERLETFRFSCGPSPAVPARFPQDFGNSVAVALDGPDDLAGPFAEAVSLTRNSLANTVIVVHRRIESLREQVRVEEVSDLLAAAADRAEGVELRFRPVDGIPARNPGRRR